MAGNLQPLDKKFPIVDAKGQPTDYFIRWAQQRQIDIGEGITLQDLIDYLAAHTIQPGVGVQITPDGNLTNSPTIDADAQAILDEITATRGSILYRGLLGWAGLGPGTLGQVLTANGAGADPAWAAAGGGGGGGWTALNFTTASATKWGSANTFASDETLTLAQGDKIEIALIIDRTIANEVMLGISPDAAMVYMTRVRTDNNAILYYNLTNAGTAVEPANLVQNGTFDTNTVWTLAGGVTISGGKLNCAGAGSIAQQAIGGIAGNSYSFKFDYTMTSGSRLRISTVGFSSVAVFTSAVLAAAGTLTGRFSSIGANFNIEADSAVFTGTIDNISVVPTEFEDRFVHQYAYSGSIELRMVLFVGAAGSSNRIAACVDESDPWGVLDNHVNLISAANKVYITVPAGDLTKIKAVKYRINNP